MWALIVLARLCAWKYQTFFMSCSVCAKPAQVQVSDPAPQIYGLQAFLKVLNAIIVLKTHLLKIKKKKKKAAGKHCQELLKGKLKAYLIFFLTLPISCQANLLSFCFMRNQETCPKAILYSQ